MFLLLATAFGSLVYALLVTRMFLQIRAQNEQLHVEHRRLRAENGRLHAETDVLVIDNAALGRAFEHQAVKALERGAVPATLPPTERLAYLFAFRHNARGTPPGDA